MQLTITETVSDSNSCYSYWKCLMIQGKGKRELKDILKTNTVVIMSKNYNI